MVVCSAIGVAGSGVDGAPRFGAGLRGTKKEAVVVSTFYAIGVTLLAFCDIWVFGFCSLFNVPLPNILFLSKFLDLTKYFN